MSKLKVNTIASLDEVTPVNFTVTPTIGGVPITISGGSGVSVVDNLSTSSATVALSANQGVILNSAIAAKYTKPNAGITSSDLASAVQGSLSKAETALQASGLKTINGVSLVGTGSITISGGAGQKFTQSTIAPTNPNIGDEWLDDSGVLYTYIDSSTGTSWTELGPTPSVIGHKFTQSTSAPVSPNVGDEWLDDNGILYTYVINSNGNTWTELGPLSSVITTGSLTSGQKFTQATTAPTNPNIGDEWLDDSGVLYTYVSTTNGNNWTELGPLAASGPTSVTKADIGLSNVDNTSDLNKPVSTATATAIAAKQNTLVSGTNIKTINGSSVLGSGDLVIIAGQKFTQSATSPLNPTLGDEWLNDTGKLFKYIDSGAGNTQWVELGDTGGAGVIGFSFTESATAPVSPKLGDEWLDASGRLYKYVTTTNGTQWVELATASSETSSSSLYIESLVPPPNPTVGTRWVDLNTGIMYTRISDGTSSAWIQL